jgi:hypothetical protein
LQQHEVRKTATREEERSRLWKPTTLSFFRYFSAIFSCLSTSRLKNK